MSGPTFLAGGARGNVGGSPHQWDSSSGNKRKHLYQHFPAIPPIFSKDIPENN